MHEARVAIYQPRFSTDCLFAPRHTKKSVHGAQEKVETDLLATLDGNRVKSE
jgi:hypothetical protein